MNSTRLGWAAVLLVGFLLAGCSGSSDGGGTREKVYKVNGKITMSGGPVANALVSLSPKGKQPVATGRTGTDGQFRLTTYDAGDGAAAGEFIVLVTKSVSSSTTTAAPVHDPEKPVDGDAMHAEATAAGDASDSALPEKYSRVDQSDLTTTIKPDGPNELTFDLKP